jgi:hypothetical protein
VTMCAFYVGLLEFHRAEARPLPPLSIMKNNRFMAMRHGLRASFTEFDGVSTYQVPATRVVEEGLEKAAIGLVTAGFEGGVERLEILRARLRDMRAPSEVFATRVEWMQAEGTPFGDALVKAVRECVVTGAQ